jgi:hypothetical protein
MIRVKKRKESLRKQNDGIKQKSAKLVEKAGKYDEIKSLVETELNCVICQQVMVEVRLGLD